MILYCFRSEKTVLFYFYVWFCVNIFISIRGNKRCFSYLILRLLPSYIYINQSLKMYFFNIFLYIYIFELFFILFIFLFNNFYSQILVGYGANLKYPCLLGKCSQITQSRQELFWASIYNIRILSSFLV